MNTTYLCFCIIEIPISSIKPVVYRSGWVDCFAESLLSILDKGYFEELAAFNGDADIIVAPSAAAASGISQVASALLVTPLLAELLRSLLTMGIAHSGNNRDNEFAIGGGVKHSAVAADWVFWELAKVLFVIIFIIKTRILSCR